MYDVLSKIKYVIKLMQTTSMQLIVSIDLMQNTKYFFANNRKIVFAAAQITAKSMCEEMNVEAELKQKRLRTTKHFGYESLDEPTQDAYRKIETTFFNVVVDTAISSLDDRFQSLAEVNNAFAVLHEFANLGREDLLQK
uniref:Zinc finger MYMtype protein 1like [Oreochromis niloticus] n=1 Tax=Lepeophtheirus salmonis TaxID=72036 RepID=A0A0K2UJK2_LEPSM